MSPIQPISLPMAKTTEADYILPGAPIRIAGTPSAIATHLSEVGLRSMGITEKNVQSLPDADARRTMARRRSLNNEDGAIAHAVSADLIYWKPQSYPVLMPLGNCLLPEITYDEQNRRFEIRWQRDKPAKGTFQSFTSDLKHFTPAVMQEHPESNRREVIVAETTRQARYIVCPRV